MLRQPGLFVPPALWKFLLDLLYGHQKRRVDPASFKPFLPPLSEVAPEDDAHSCPYDLDEGFLLGHHEGGGRMTTITITTRPTPEFPAEDGPGDIQPESLWFSNQIKVG